LFGKDAVKQAEKISDILFGEGDRMKLIAGFNKEDIDALYAET
jgi:hypothetical protein